MLTEKQKSDVYNAYCTIGMHMDADNFIFLVESEDKQLVKIGICRAIEHLNPLDPSLCNSLRAVLKKEGE